jgi:hypothetical protein
LSNEKQGIKQKAKYYAQRILGMGKSEQITRETPFSESIKFHRTLAPPTEKGSGVGFVTSPYMQEFQKIWGVQLFEDYEELRKMYKTVPYVNAAINVTANLTMSSGFDLIGGRDEVREYLIDMLDELNVDQILRPAIIDMLVLGNAFIEKCYEKEDLLFQTKSEYEKMVQQKYVMKMGNPDYVTPDEIPEAEKWNALDETILGTITQLKVLDPATIRIRADAYGNIFGAVQLVIVPPVVFRSWQLIHLKYMPRSEFQYSVYGFSPLNSLIGIQKKINAFEDAMTQIVLAYGKPLLIVKVGTPERPATTEEVESVAEAFKNRQPASDIIVKGNYEVQPIQALSPASSQINWYLEYLERQRDAILGVPKIFLGQTEGATRATADIALLEYIARLTALQANISQQLEDNLFKPLIRAKFGEGEEIPRIRWREILPPTKSQNIVNVLNMYKAGLITLKEARQMIGLETTDEIIEELKAKAKTPQKFEISSIPSEEQEITEPTQKVVRK